MLGACGLSMSMSGWCFLIGLGKEDGSLVISRIRLALTCSPNGRGNYPWLLEYRKICSYCREGDQGPTKDSFEYWSEVFKIAWRGALERIETSKVSKQSWKKRENFKKYLQNSPRIPESGPIRSLDWNQSRHPAESVLDLCIWMAIWMAIWEKGQEIYIASFFRSRCCHCYELWHIMTII